MKCVICKDDTVPADDYLSCVCAPGSKRIAPANVAAGRPERAYLSNFHPNCEECSTGTAPNAAQSACLTIGSGVELGSDGEAQCSAEGSYLTETDT